MSYQPISSDSENQSLRKINAISHETQYDIEELNRQSMGLRGAVVLSGAGSLPTGTYVSLQFLNETVITSITAAEIVNASSLHTTIKEGNAIFGTITGLTISSGLVIAYKA